MNLEENIVKLRKNCMKLGQDIFLEMTTTDLGLMTPVCWKVIDWFLFILLCDIQLAYQCHIVLNPDVTVKWLLTYSVCCWDQVVRSGAYIYRVNKPLPYNCWHKVTSFPFITIINEYKLILLVLKGKITLNNTVLLLTSSHQLYNSTFGKLIVVFTALLITALELLEIIRTLCTNYWLLMKFPMNSVYKHLKCIIVW